MTKLEELVIKEAKKLKKFATKEELSRLDYSSLAGNIRTRWFRQNS